MLVNASMKVIVNQKKIAVSLGMRGKAWQNDSPSEDLKQKNDKPHPISALVLYWHFGFGFRIMMNPNRIEIGFLGQFLAVFGRKTPWVLNDLTIPIISPCPLRVYTQNPALCAFVQV